ncbi:MAG TPA: hypothetical protein VK369_03410 [Segetibacter sp.]|nr:hypothetical protein [Segetibacter sp.]
MLKRVFLLIIFAAVISAASAFGSPIVKEKTYADEVAAVELASDKTGIKDELDDKSLKQILADVLTIKGGKIGEIISKFLSNTSHWVWLVVEGGLPENVNGLTQLTSDGAQTILDGEKFQNATPLSVARTILHEMIHAYLTLYFMYDAENARKDYPAILNEWMTSKDPDYNNIQHDEIERSFIDDIALALDEYSETVGLVNDDKHVYTDLAWGGLDFQNNIQLTADTKKRIQNRLLAEQLNKTFGTETPVAFK